MKGPYDDIINLPHHVSKTRQRMSMLDRAAQFSPFAALTGYDATIKETGRLTDEKIELDEGALTILNMKFQTLIDNLKEQPDVSITYFKPDIRKTGGSYETVTGVIKKINDFERTIVFKDETVVLMDNVVNIEGTLF